MVVPLAGRAIAAFIGGLLVITAAKSVIGTIIVPRPTGSWLIRSVDKTVDAAYQLAVKRLRDYRTRDRVLATQAAVILIVQLIAWLAIFFVGYSLLLWPFIDEGITKAFTTAGPALWFIGDSSVSGAWERTIQDCAVVLRPGHDHAPDRVPADAVFGLQPQGDRHRAAQRPGRRAVLGA